MMQYDGQFDISLGKYRKETSWKNKKVSWSWLVTKCVVTHNTAESYGDYVNSSKARQDSIKDIGGFVGGYINTGRRKKGNILHRQLITLDLDFADNDFWDLFTLCYNCSAILYSTHKHSPSNPRFRLVIPLDREVLTDEYLAISRRIAGNLGIDAFDDTTFQPERMMYWPSTSRDGVYVFHHQDGPWLKADDVLGTYQDWRDSSQWPLSSRHTDAVHRSATKQGDPLEKPGLIGAFCRCYSVADVIETFLSDVYEPCDVEGRFTYKHGTTSAGLVLYDDRYAYSHHGTDPISGKLCNAFDLVRIHLFGDKDEDTAAEVPTNKRPSFMAMQDFVAADAGVRLQLVNERLEGAAAAFLEVDAAGYTAEEEIETEGVINNYSTTYLSAPGTEEEAAEAAEVADERWKSLLEFDRKGNIQGTIDNIVLILENDPRLKGCIAWDEFEQRAVARRRLPWRGIGGKQGRYLKDTDDDNLAHYLERTYGIGSTKIPTALGVIYERHRFHPVRAYLNALEWDGVPRVEGLLRRYIGAEDSPFNRTIMRKVMAAAVARVFSPGCKFDYMLVLITPEQGRKKSTLIRALGRQWYSDSFSTVQGKEAFEQLQGVWIVEAAELSSLKRAEVETVKHYISKQEDRYRVAYGRRLENFPRQCIFIGTGNEVHFIQDHTGGRRFWPVVGDLFPRQADPEKIGAEEINQIWAEAVTYYRAGEKLYLNDAMEEEAKALQLEHTTVDARTDLIEAYLNTLLPLNWQELDTWTRREFLNGGHPELVGVLPRERVTIAEIWVECLGGQVKDMTTHNTKPLHYILRRLSGWEESGKLKYQGLSVRGYRRKLT